MARYAILAKFVSREPSSGFARASRLPITLYPITPSENPGLHSTQSNFEAKIAVLHVRRGTSVRQHNGSEGVAVLDYRLQSGQELLVLCEIQI